MKEINLLTKKHESTSRDYVSRMIDDKVEAMEVASQFEFDYWDGDRRFGYGGYRYNGSWKPLAEEIITRYELNTNSKIIDFGCGMGHLIFEIKKILNCHVVGLDISQYAKEKSPINDKIQIHDIRNKTTFSENEFDLALSLMTLHNFEIQELSTPVKEMERIAKSSYVAVESFRTNQELFNLQCWALTCRSFFSPDGWRFIFEQNSYSGDYEFLYFR